METPGTPSAKTTVFIVDDHPLVRDWLSRLINEEDDMEVCGWAESADAAIPEIERIKPGITIVDISLRGKSGLELIRSLTDRNPHELILVLSMHDESVYANRALKAGARGYVSKREATEHVIQALRRVLGGGMYISETMVEGIDLTRGRKSSPAGEANLLSDRELEVFRLLAAGRETPAIARELSVSLKTVQSYCARIKEKLNLHNATELLQAATRWADAQDAG